LPLTAPAIRVVTRRCIGSGNCVADAPSVFNFDADGTARIYGDATTLPPEMLHELVENCPAQALELTDDSTE
jgi:ferredoxin